VFRNWWAWPLPKLGVGVTLELRNGLRYRVRSGTTDLAVVNEAAILNPYLGPGYLQLSEDAIVIDVGANIGDFTVHVASLCPRGRIYAVEPLADNVEMIVLNSGLNGISNVEIVQVALGASEGEVEIDVAGSHSSTYYRTRDAATQRVRLTTLAILMKEHGIDRVDLLKMDCEGAEWDILPCSDEILPRIRQICMELHLAGGWTSEKLANWLRDRGYEVIHTPAVWNGRLWAIRQHCGDLDCGIKHEPILAGDEE
jgi:FkbM family methyltransferase